MKYPLRKTIFTALLSIFLFLNAFSLKAETVEEGSLSKNISLTMNQLLIKLDLNRSEYSQNNELFYQALDSDLSKIINFKRIALKVMGKHSRKATKEERAQFITVFKLSLYKAYAAILLNNGNISINVLNSSVNRRNPKKAKTNLEIINATGTSFPVSYSLHKGKDQIYRVENIVIMGINIGLSFRDRFQHQMKIHKGSIKAVINNWSSKVVV